jgi:hypothetical protein
MGRPSWLAKPNGTFSNLAPPNLAKPSRSRLAHVDPCSHRPVPDKLPIDPGEPHHPPDIVANSSARASGRRDAAHLNSRVLMPSAAPKKSAMVPIAEPKIDGGGVVAHSRLGAATGLRLPATLLFDYPSPRPLACWLQDELVGQVPQLAASPSIVPSAKGEPRAAIQRSRAENLAGLTGWSQPEIETRMEAGGQSLQRSSGP